MMAVASAVVTIFIRSPARTSTLSAWPGGLGPDGRHARQPEPIRHLGGDVGAPLELLAAHDAELEGVEGPDAGVRQGALVGIGEELEDVLEDAPGEVDLRESDTGDVDLSGHDAPI
jgi:hypothetical protein